MVATLSCRQCQPHQKPTEVLMLQMVSRLLPEVTFFLNDARVRAERIRNDGVRRFRCARRRSRSGGPNRRLTMPRSSRHRTVAMRIGRLTSAAIRRLFWSSRACAQV